VEQLSDGHWHWLADIGELTSYPDEWTRELARDSRFECDATKSMIRLRGPKPGSTTT
jgi:hypothetical protein